MGRLYRGDDGDRADQAIRGSDGRRVNVVDRTTQQDVAKRLYHDRQRGAQAHCDFTGKA
jgi:hypothetical protein